MSILDDIRALDDLALESQRVLIRVDFDVPVDRDTGVVLDAARIRAALPTLRHAVEAGARVILATHRADPGGRPTPDLSLESVGAELATLTGWDVLLPDACVGDMPRKLVAELRPGQLVLLENLRFDPGESANDEGFARRLAALCDVYVNEAFSLAHADAASLVALPRLFAQRGSGIEFRHQLECLARVRERPEPPLVLVLGGQNLQDKLSWLQALGPRCDQVCWAGTVGHTLLAASGVSLPRAGFEVGQLPRARSLFDGTRERRPEFVLPSDLVLASGRVVSPGEVPADQVPVDVGPRTVEDFARRIARSRTVLWHGPLGIGEATLELARRVADSDAFVVVIGESTAAAVAPVAEQLGLVGGGGEAARRWLRGERLPAVEALRGAPG